MQLFFGLRHPFPPPGRWLSLRQTQYTHIFFPLHSVAFCTQAVWGRFTYRKSKRLPLPLLHYQSQYSLLTPWCRVVLEKLTGLQLVKKFPAFHGTRRFITALTSFRHLSLSWASPIQSIYPHPTSRRSILILSTHLRLGLRSGPLPSGFPTKTLYTPSPDPYAPHAQPISFFAITALPKPIAKLK